MTPEYRLMLQSRAKQQQQDKLDKQQHFDSQRQHLNNVHKDNYGQLQNLVKSDFYKTVQTTLKKNNKKVIKDSRGSGIMSEEEWARAQGMTYSELRQGSSVGSFLDRREKK